MARESARSAGRGRPRDEGLAARRRAEILRHAIRHFARDGYAGADLDAIAADAGCSKGTLYRYFASKEALFHSGVDTVMQGLLEATAPVEGEDPVAAIEDGVRAYLAYFDKHPEYVEMLILERAVFRDRKKPTYFEYRDANAHRWQERFEALIDAGRFRAVPPERILDVLGNLVYGTAFTNYFAGRRSSLDQQVEDILDVLFHGLLAPEKPDRRSSRASRPRRGSSKR